MKQSSAQNRPDPLGFWRALLFYSVCNSGDWKSFLSLDQGAPDTSGTTAPPHVSIQGVFV
jgi:hypothetical protein